jgi:hypothetical protein
LPAPPGRPIHGTTTWPRGVIRCGVFVEFHNICLLLPGRRW